MSRDAPKGQRRWKPLEQELGALVSCLSWVLRIMLASSTRAVCVLNCRAISLGPMHVPLCANKCQLMPVHFTPIFSFDSQNPPACWGGSIAILILYVETLKGIAE